MVFNSIDFLIFFPIVICIYYIIPKKARKFWLLVASYYFYMSWNATYALLILASTVITYASGILLTKSDKVSTRKWIVAGSFISNLGILVFFKYFDFLISNLNSIFNVFGISSINNPVNVLLPVGISFYTFQALGYTVDCYRKDIEAEKNFINYALFVSFFPQLVAGPIEKSKNLLSQLNKLDSEKMFSYEKTVSGFSLMCWGMFMKVVIADHLAVFVDGVWNNLHMAGFSATLVAAIGFSIQIYCDFAGYSAIAIGAARMMGFDLMENFNTPYFAESIKDFWKRWHISLSTWFKDYLYIPLGGSRCSRIKKYRNIMITFLLSGLWHGANWTYVIWGAVHGVFQVIGDLLKPVYDKLGKAMNVNKESFSTHFGKAFVTFFLTTFAWIFFKAETVSDAFLFIKHLVTKPDPWALFNGSLYNFGIDTTDFHVLLLGILLLIVVDALRYVKKCDFGAILLREEFWFRMIILIVLIVMCVIYGAYGINFDSAQFIYFQF